MHNIKLTQQHIEHLYLFTRQHYVFHFDLQTELVDHMANAIETTWKTSPGITFEEARDKSFKTFGVFGFMDVVEKRQKAMSKRYMKLLWSFAKNWFSFLEVLKTVVIFISTYVLFSLNFGKQVAIVAFIILFVSIFFKGFKFVKYIKNKEQSKEKLWLLEDLIFRNASANAMLQITFVLNMYNTIENFWHFKYAAFIAALLFTVLAIYSYVSVVVLPKNAEMLLNKIYPEYSL